MSGVVEEFDERAGYGRFRADNGEHFFFHCVAIGDASRQIELHVRASGERVVGHLGRDEIVNLRPLD